jgi:transcriptional regulator with XRE-family HTH domain
MSKAKKKRGPAPGTVYTKMKRTPIGTRIVSFRREKGFSQTDLAAKTGLTKRMISFYESRCEAIPINKLQRIAQALGIGLDELVNGNTNPTNLTTSRALLKRLETAKTLPEEKQKALIHVIDSMVS